MNLFQRRTVAKKNAGNVAGFLLWSWPVVNTNFSASVFQQSLSAGVTFFREQISSGSITLIADIDGLWGLAFENGGKASVPDALYFTAGLNGEADGLFGSIVPVPKDAHGGGDDD